MIPNPQGGADARVPHHGRDATGAWAATGWGSGGSWHQATDAALDRLYETGGSPWVVTRPVAGTAMAGDAATGGAGAHALEEPTGRRTDLVLAFVTSGLREDFGRILGHLKRELGAAHVVGCSAAHGIAGGRILEGRESVVVLAVVAPGIEVRSVALTPEVVERAVALRTSPERQAAVIHRALGVMPGDANGWIVLADHASVDAADVAALWTAAYPGEAIIGAVASTTREDLPSTLFHDAMPVPDGVVAVAIGGAWGVQAITSQGCTPIGRPWTITEVDGDRAIMTIGRRPALGVLVETVRSLPAALVDRARGNLFAGLAVNEVRMTGGRDDLMSCALVGADQQTGAIMVLGRPAVGQTLQFQYREPVATTADLASRLEGSAHLQAGGAPLAAILFADDARKESFFGAPDRDAITLREIARDLPVAGFGCRAEIGPVGGRVVAVTHAACVGMIVPVPRP